MTFLHALPIAFLVVCAGLTVAACAGRAYDFLLDGLIERTFPSRFLDGPTSREES